MVESNHVFRTKEAIRTSFLELLEYKAVSEMAVTEVVDKAKVSRTTFYRYYKDLYDLLNDCFFTYCVGSFQWPPEECDDQTFFSLLSKEAVEGAKRVKQYRKLFLASLDCKDIAFNLEFKGSIIQGAQDESKNLIKRLGITTENCILPINQIASLCANIQTLINEDWAREGCVESPEDIARTVSIATVRFVRSMKRDGEDDAGLYPFV